MPTNYARGVSMVLRKNKPHIARFYLWGKTRWYFFPSKTIIERQIGIEIRANHFAQIEPVLRNCAEKDEKARVFVHRLNKETRNV